MTYEVRVVMYDKKSKTETDVTGSLNIKQNGNQIVLTEKKPGSLKDGYEYCAYTKGITKIGATDEVRTKLKTVFPKKAPVASADVKVKGDFDVIRPETDVTVTPKVKNFYDYNLSEANLEIYKYDEKGKNIIYKGTGADNPFFDVEWDGKAYTLRIKSSAVINHMTDKFAVGLKVNDALATKKPVKLTFKMSTAKFAQSVKEINLSSKDRYSMGMVKISTLTEGVSEIESVVIDSPADKEGNPYFVLKDLGGGNYGIAYRGSRIPQIKKGTVKLKVFLSGNNTSQTRKEKPNATISVKVNVK
jgi:hypothetical protein